MLSTSFAFILFSSTWNVVREQSKNYVYRTGNIYMPIASRRVLGFSITITLLFTIDKYLYSQQPCILDQPVANYSQDSLIMTRGKRKKMIVRRACRER